MKMDEHSVTGKTMRAFFAIEPHLTTIYEQLSLFIISFTFTQYGLLDIAVVFDAKKGPSHRT